MAITIVTSGANTDGSAVTSFTQAIGSSAAGNLLYFAIRSGNAAQTISSFTDTQGNNWIALRSDQETNTGSTYFIYYCLSAKGGGANSVTVNFGLSQQCTRFWVEAHESRANFLWSTDTGGAIATAASGTAMNSGNITTTGANDILLSHAFSSSLSTTASGAWSTLQTSAFTDILMDQIVTTAATYAGTATGGSSAAWGINIAAFKAVLSPSTAKAVPFLLDVYYAAGMIT